LLQAAKLLVGYLYEREVIYGKNCQELTDHKLTKRRSFCEEVTKIKNPDIYACAYYHNHAVQFCVWTSSNQGGANESKCG